MANGRYSKIIILSIIILNVLFTAAVLVVFWHTTVEPTTLIISWFGFTSSEAIVTALIKLSKVKRGSKGD